MSNFQNRLNKKLQEQIDKYETAANAIYNPEAEAAYLAYTKVKAPDNVSKISLKAPSKDSSIQRSNFLVTILKENRVLFFTILMSFFFFGVYAAHPVGAVIFCVYCLIIASEHYVFRKSQAHDAVILVFAAAAYPIAKTLSQVFLVRM